MSDPLNVELRPLEAGDERAVRAFAAAIPEHDRNFLKEDVSDPEVVRHWFEDRTGVRCAAVDANGRIHGVAALLRGVARASHVAELQLVVAAASRGRGIGRSLARRMMLEAFERDVHKITVEITAEDAPTIALFSALGFTAEALLTDQLRDADGALHDVLVFAHTVDGTWPELLAAGVDRETG